MVIDFHILMTLGIKLFILNNSDSNHSRAIPLICSIKIPLPQYHFRQGYLIPAQGSSDDRCIGSQSAYTPRLFLTVYYNYEPIIIEAVSAYLGLYHRKVETRHMYSYNEHLPTLLYTVVLLT